MRMPWKAPLVVWAARDLMRHPLPTLLLWVSLASLVALVALVLLLDHTLSNALRRLTDQSPAVVVRRVTPGGWAPIPIEHALHRLQAIAGVLHPRGRVWGVVRGPGGPVTLVGVNDPVDHNTVFRSLPPLRAGEAWVGQGLVPETSDTPLLLGGRRDLTLKIVGQLPDDSAMATHDVAVVHVRDARRLLGLEADQASDLALDVFHEDEADALRSVLAGAFDWPVQITTRSEQLERGLADISQRSGILLIAFGPALLAMVLLVAAMGAAGRRRRWESGLFKALGWTSADILRLHIYRGLLVGVPALTAGVGAAYLLLFQPGITWVARLLFDWSGPPPGFYLTVQGVAGGFALSALLVGLPFLAAVFWTGWQTAGGDPADCIEGGL